MSNSSQETSAQQVRSEIVGIRVEGPWLSIEWGDGHSSRFHALWLRHACGCAVCGDPKIGFRHSLLMEIPEDSLPCETDWSAAGHLRVVWSPDGHVSDFDPAFLRRACNSERSRAERRFQLQAWGPEIADRLPRFPYPEVLAAPEQHLGALESLLRYGFVLLDGVPVTEEETVKITELAGVYRPGTYGLYDIKLAENPKYYGDLAVALDPHCDEPYRTQTAAITIFHPMVASGDGGDTILVDGLRATEALKQEAPEAFDLLSRFSVPYERREGTAHFHRLMAPIIGLERDGSFAGIRFLDRYLLPLDLPNDLIEPFYQALRRFETYLADPANQLRFKLLPGQAMIFNNQRLLHGRTAFDPKGAKRHLRHSNTDLDSFYSKLRLLYAQFGRDEADMIYPSGAVL